MHHINLNCSFFLQLIYMFIHTNVLLLKNYNFLMYGLTLKTLQFICLIFSYNLYGRYSYKFLKIINN